jgi:hypothetical protein
LAGKALVLVEGELVAVAVDDLPPAVLAPVDLGDPQDGRLDRTPSTDTEVCSSSTVQARSPLTDTSSRPSGRP